MKQVPVTLPNKLKRYATSAVLVVALINPNHYIAFLPLKNLHPEDSTQVFPW